MKIILLILLNCVYSTAFADLEEKVVATIKILKDRKKAQNTELIKKLKSDFYNTKDKEIRLMAALGIGLLQVDDNPKVAEQFLLSAKGMSKRATDINKLIKYNLAHTYLQRGFYKQSLSEIKGIYTRKTGSNWRRKVGLLKLKVLFKLKHFNTYIKQYNLIKKNIKRTDIDAIKNLAVSYEMTGKYRKSAKRLEDLAVSYPTTETSRWAFRKLMDWSCKNKRYRHFYSKSFLYRLSRNASLDVGIRAFISEKINEPIFISKRQKRELNFVEKARLLVQMRLFKEAEKLVPKIEGRLKNARKNRGELILTLAKIYDGLRNVNKSEYFYSKYLHEFPYNRKSLRVRETLARIFTKKNLFEEASKNYQYLISRGGRRRLRWHHFWNEFKAKRMQAALKLLEKSKNYVMSQDPEEPIATSYWRGKIFESLGQEEKAKKIFSELILSSPDSFYSTIAIAEDNDLADLQKRLVYRAAESKINHNQLLNSLYSTKSNDFTVTDPKIKIAKNFLVLGLNQHAKSQLKFLQPIRNKSPQEIRSLVNIAWLADDYSRVRNIVNRNGYSSSKLKDIEPEIYNSDNQNIFFPLAHNYIIETMSDICDVDRYLLLSIMRAESMFKTEALSYVGARGLMQIMPQTAIKISKLLHDQGFLIKELNNEIVNIAYGSFYLKRLLDYYNDNSFLAIAAYNAGPNAVNSWVTKCQDCSIPEFVEAIPYRETRRYVKKVIRNFTNYKQIYEKTAAFANLPALPGDFKKEMVIF